MLGTVNSVVGDISRADYDGYGNTDDSVYGNLGYCGEYTDYETGFIYLRARYYDPSLGRFTSEDPHWNPENMIYGDNPVDYAEINKQQKLLLGELLSNQGYNTLIPDLLAIKQSSNLYAYCMNNPVNFTDPSGRLVLVGVTITVGQIIAAGLTVVLLLDLLNGGTFIKDFTDAIYKKGKSVIDALKYAKAKQESQKDGKEADKDSRLKGEPGEVKREGNKETKIGKDGRAVKERHHTDHGNPSKHTNPHDHEITWDEEGNPIFGPPINYPDEVPAFHYFR